MATDIKISELNEITANDDINYIIVNDRENAGDEGITKKITLENFLTPNIVQETNILNSAVTNDKIQDLAVDCSKIASNTITCNQILGCTINNPSLDSNSVDNRVLNNNCNFTVKGLLVNDGCVHISNPATGSLNVVSGVTRLNGINYNWPSSQIADKFLKTDGAGNLAWQEAVPGESTALVFAEIMPVGTIIPWGGGNSGTDVPDDKWLPCNGGTFNGAAYPELSAAIGENFGTRVSDTFKLPDMRGRVPLGEAEAPGNSDGTDTCTFLLGVKGGKYNHTLTINEMPQHRHTFNITADYGYKDSLVAPARYIAGQCHTTPIGPADSRINDQNYINTCGGNQTHNNIQPYTVTRYIIKARPDDIEQFNPVITPGLSAKNASGQQANITLNTTEIGLKVSDQFTFDTGGKLENLMIPPIWTAYPDLDAQLIGAPRSNDLVHYGNAFEPVEVFSRGNSSPSGYATGQPQLAIGGNVGNQVSIKIYVPVAVTRTIRARRQYNYLTDPWTLRAWDEPSRLISGSRFDNTAVWSVDPFFDTTIQGIQDVSMNLPAGTYIFTLRADDFSNPESIFYSWDQGGLIDYKTVYPVLNEPGDPLWDYTGGP
jgi:microcystin-dependent protein